MHIAVIAGFNLDASSLGLLKMPRLARLGRLVRKLEKTFSGLIFRVCKLLITVFFLSHIIGCTFYFVGVLPENQEAVGIPWTTKYNMPDASDKNGLLTQYLASVFWAIMTLLKTPVFKVCIPQYVSVCLPEANTAHRFKPHTNYERAFMSITLIIGVMYLAVFVGTVMSIIMQVRISSVLFGRLVG